MTKNFDLGQHLTRSAVNVRDYGAKGDEVTDDTAALQAAIAGCLASGRALYIPAGTYIFSASLRINNARGITIYGDGYGSCLKAVAGGTHILIHVGMDDFSPIRGMHLRDFRVDANGAGQLDTGVVTYNNAIGSITGMWIENATRVSGASGQAGITASAGNPGGYGSRVVISRNVIRNTSKAAINYTSEAVTALIEGNYISDVAGNGTTPGIQLNGGFNARVIGNMISNAQGPGIYVNRDSLGNTSSNAVISDNIIASCGVSSTTEGDGIRVTAGSLSPGRLIVSNNNVYDCGTNTNGGSGIYLINQENVVVDGNHCRNNRYDGIRVQGCSHVSITGNRCTGNNLAGSSYAGGVQLFGACAHVAITGNHLSDDKATKTQSYGIITDGGAVLTYLTIKANHTEGNLGGPMLLNVAGVPMDIDATIERQTLDGSLAPMIYFGVPNGAACKITASAVAKRSDSGARAIYAREALFSAAAGAVTQQGATTTLGTDIESDPTWGGLTLAASGGLAVVYAQGLGGATINWRSTLRVQTI